MYLKETAAKKKLETADLNKFFTCVFNAENNFETIPTSANQTVNRNEFNDNSIFFCLQNLKSIKLTGPDGFGNYVLANAARSLLKTVKLIVSTTFNKGTIPEQWKPSRGHQSTKTATNVISKSTAQSASCTISRKPSKKYSLRNYTVQSTQMYTTGNSVSENIDQPARKYLSISTKCIPCITELKLLHWPVCTLTFRKRWTKCHTGLPSKSCGSRESVVHFSNSWPYIQQITFSS